MLRESESIRVESSTKMGRNRMPRSATDCTESVHVVVARAMWPRKTAAHWAARAGVKERMAKYWLSGQHEVSDSGKLAIIRELG